MFKKKPITPMPERGQRFIDVASAATKAYVRQLAELDRARVAALEKYGAELERANKILTGEIA